MAGLFAAPVVVPVFPITQIPVLPMFPRRRRLAVSGGGGGSGGGPVGVGGAALAARARGAVAVAGPRLLAGSFPRLPLLLLPPELLFPLHDLRVELVPVLRDGVLRPGGRRSGFLIGSTVHSGPWYPRDAPYMAPWSP